MSIAPALAIFVLLAAGVAAADQSPFWGDAENWAAIVAAGLEPAGEPLPTLSGMGAALTPRQAYRVQEALLDLRVGAGARAGYKAGLTSRISRFRFRSDTPVSGVLPAAGRVPAGGRVRARPGLLLEAELGFTLRRAPDRPLPDVAALIPLLASVRPVVELPVNPFGKARPTGLDLIAVNVGAHRYVPGRARAFGDWREVERVFVEVFRDGEIETRGKARNVEPGQLEGLLWLVNRELENGREIAADDLFLTGSTTPIGPALPGRYEVRFRGLGTVAFTVDGRR